MVDTGRRCGHKAARWTHAQNPTYFITTHLTNSPISPLSQLTMSRYYRSKDIANIDDFNPGQEYYVVGAHLGAAKVGEKVSTEHGNIWNAGLSGSDKWTIHRVDDGYSIKSVEHGSYLGFHHTELSGATNPSAGLTASKEPFAWTGDGVFRFTVPNTEIHIDFSSVANTTSSANETTESDFAASESDEAAFACEMAAAGHNFDSNFKIGGDLGVNSGRDSDSKIDGNAEGQDSGYSADIEPGQSVGERAGPQLHAFGRSRFPPGYFGK
ncbi:hypothetical protein K523DRAFT_376028 [Schizophyllum commune Tattone D]|nr:hypothetical protein K523DRAFT_376028 [Schizophyllum commune Tattone D]